MDVSPGQGPRQRRHPDARETGRPAPQSGPGTACFHFFIIAYADQVQLKLSITLKAYIILCYRVKEAQDRGQKIGP